MAAVAAPAQTPALDQAAPASVRGHVADPSGARIPGATVTVTNALGVPVKSAVANETGEYSISGLAPGSYIVEASRSGFALYTSVTFRLEAGQTKIVEVKMTLPIAQQEVNVSSDSDDSVSTEAGANANAIVLKGKDLDALSDDPDELSDELTALAGPAAGPNGGQIYIDGFTGGELPPKSAIRQIVINQNPFSAQFSRLGYGRIEILTKPGSDKLHGRVFAMGNDGGINAGNPFVPTLPSYYSYMLNGTVSGPLSKWASYFFSIQRRVNQNVNVYSIANGPLFDPTTNLYSVATGSTVHGTVFSPGSHMEISPRLDMQLGQKNTLTLRYQFFRMNSNNNLQGNTSLGSQATSSTRTENSVQADDTQIINDHLVNETRAEYRLETSSGNPASTAPQFGVAGIFSGGGSGTQYSNDRTVHLELQNFTTLSAGKHAIKFGTWMRDNREADSGNSGFNGSFVFPSISAFISTWNGTQQGLSFDQLPQSGCPTDQNPNQTGSCLPIKLSYTTGPTAFRGNLYDAALFYQDDWKINPFLTISLGLRWESQNHVSDHSDWAPRFAFAYALDGHGKGSAPKTVLRGGYGLFYDRFEVDDLMTLEQNNGGANSQVLTVIANPTCFTTGSLSTIPDITADCGAGTASTPQIHVLDPHYHSPYTEMLGMSLERQVSKTMTLTLTYLHAYGVHQMATINANAYLPGTVTFNSTTHTASGTRPNPNLGIVDEFFPEAIFKENQLIVNVNARVSRNFSLSGFYNASWANGNTGTAENSYNLRDSYGRASFVRPQWLFLMGNYNGPWGVSFNPFLVAQAGQPYNYSTPFDLTGDNFFNNRPAVATSDQCASGDSRYVSTSYGCFDVTPDPGETLVPYNIGNSPSAVAVNMRISRSFGIGPETEGPAGPQGGGGDHGGGFHGRGGRFGGGFGGGPFGGGMRGGPMGGGGSSRKYSLTFSAQAMNLFNNVNYGKPMGTVTASNFGRSTGLNGFMFAPRRFFFQAGFQF
ncbi:MAG TPA: carboxypeptidase regulatory-like domain-containing protein [Terracidiphilus sp.]